MSYKQVHFGCLHEVKGVEATTEIPDFHPLTKRDIYNLLQRAKQTGDWQVRNSIQIRLTQGVRGYMCPRLIDGPVAKKENAVSSLYLEHRYRAPTTTLVNQLHRMMNY